MTVSIARDTVVTLDYKVTDSDGQLIDAGTEPMSYLHGGYEGLFAKIEEDLEGKAVGYAVTIRLEPAEAFGEYDADLVQIEALDAFPEGLEVGAVLEGMPEGGDEAEMRLFHVTDIADGKVVLDGNHPLAGVVLDFSCTVAAVRPASPAEVSAGMAG
ncbi:MAG: peptidylprolyl isomerase [Phaeospirillum sp.]|nr:peptidylprolyl isomerase [Phaeospirillum sp.]